MIKISERSHGKVIGLETSGEITESDIKKVQKPIEKAIKKYGKINWLIVCKTAKYKNLKAFYVDMMWLLKNIKYFERMAVVGDKKWEEWLVKADSLVFGEKYFDIKDLDKAWAYIEG